MTSTLTWKFDSLDQARNARDDLRSNGIPMEKLFVDEGSRLIKIIVPEATEPGIAEMLERHGLTQVH